MLTRVADNGGYVIVPLLPWQVFLQLSCEFAVFFTALRQLPGVSCNGH